MKGPTMPCGRRDLAARRDEGVISYAWRGTKPRAGDIIGSGTVGTGRILERSRVHRTEAFPRLRGHRVRVAAERLGRLGVARPFRPPPRQM
jgi:hypothetical protein